MANYPGVTVEKKSGTMTLDDGRHLDLIDLPGIYSLIPKSTDERIAVDVLKGRLKNVPTLHGVVVVLDAGNLGPKTFSW